MANTLQHPCLENPIDGEAWQDTVHRVAKNWTSPKQLCAHRCKAFFDCGSCAPVRVEHEGGRAAWVVGTMVAPTVQGYGLPQPLEYWPYQSLFSNLWYLTIRRPLRLVFAHSSTVQALRGLPCLGSFSVVPCIRHIEGPPPSAPLPAPGWGPTL